MTRTGWIVVSVAVLFAAWTRYRDSRPSAEHADPREIDVRPSKRPSAQAAPMPTNVRVVDRGCDLDVLSEVVSGSVEASLRGTAADPDEDEAESASPEALERAGRAVEAAIASGYLDAERARELRSTLSDLDLESRMDLQLELARAVNDGSLELSGPEALVL